MTQVPPSRYSSATITRAPCCAAIRAARTPPDPPPMTKRSTSKSDMLHIVPALLHLGAHPGHDVDGKIVAPASRIGHAFVERLRLLDEHLLAERRLIEGQKALQFGFSEMAGVEARRRVHELAGARLVVSFDIGRDLVEVLGPHQVG